MSLSAALLLAALAVLAAIAVHGWWSARRATPRQATGVVPSEPPSRVEPTLGPLPALGAAPDAPVPVAASARRGPRIDALIDAIAALAVEAPVSGDTVLAHLPPSRRAGSKPMLVEGLNAESGQWEPPQAGARYGELQAAVQLANRSGALNEIEYSEFAQKLQTFAEGVGAMADFPDMLQVVARARELDALAGPLDAQLAVRLVARTVAWSVGYVQQCASRHGLVPGAVAGRLVLPAQDEGAPPVLVLEFDAQAALADDPQAAALREVILSLDVPQTAAELEPFPSWLRTAQALAEDMDAALLDDAGRPITLPAFDAIGKDLTTLYQTLESHDLAAGSAAARRLFAG